ncbi:fimbrial protein [Escherichia coli]|uniref:F4 family fimbrial subunit n=1 Tax=Escherichia coli TaxID=562 RepID=UPI0017E300AB|nr:fimbrial protein [Escherichia coli]HDQ6571530.1 fimbrial protein [Escherichia coli Ou:H7]EET2571642.1 fimbrial protein [Escherichia coli]EEW8237961.1 fimbrial protein [Escherichia coli]EFM9370272.1 fimbrial protein [Escherichia coli]EIW7044248.1 fimbrial protein [Escherichia coli]
MKKTLIALAVAASAAVSGSAMAWTANGTGGSVDLGGTLTPVEKVTPWEVKVGTGNNNLNAEIASGQQVVDITLPSDLLVLGVRSVNGGFSGKVGISPQLDYGNTLNTNSFSNGLADLTLEVTDTNGNHIGSLSTKLAAGGLQSDSTASSKASIIAQNEGDAFWGGIPSSSSDVLNASELANRVDSTVMENFLGTSFNQVGSYANKFTDEAITFSAYYLSALLTDNPVNITLDTAPTSDVTWKAQLPVTVSYQ